MNKFDIGENVWTIDHRHIVAAEVRSIHFSSKENKYKLFIPSLKTTIESVPESDLVPSFKEAKKKYHNRYKNDSFFNQVVNLFF